MMYLFIVLPPKSLAESSLCATATAAATEMLVDFPLRTLEGVSGLETLFLLVFALVFVRNIRFGDGGGSDINHG